MSTINIAFNKASEVAPQSLITQQRNIERSNRQLSTGRIATRASDSPHLVAFETRLEAQQIGAKTARTNINLGVSLAQTADARLGSMVDPLYRLNELALFGMNDFLSDQDRSLIQFEADQIVEGLQNTAQFSQFNGKSLFNGRFLQQNIQNHGHASLGSLLSLPNIDFDDHRLSRNDDWSDQDLVFIVDNTLSMGSAIDSLKDDLSLVISQLAGSHVGNMRIGIVATSNSLTPEDPVGLPIKALELTAINHAETGTVLADNLNVINDFLDSLLADSPGEHIDQATEYAIDNFDFAEGALQQLVFVGSAGDEAQNATVEQDTLDLVSDFVSGGPLRSASAIATQNGTRTNSTYFQDQLVAIGQGSYLEYPATSMADAISSLTNVERTINGVNFLTQEKSEDSWYWIDDLLNLVNDTRHELGAFNHKLTTQYDVQDTINHSMAKALAESTSADMAKVSGELRSQLILRSATVVNQGHELAYFGQSLLSMLDQNFQ